MVHELKIWPRYFDAVDSGVKTFEVRKNDRNFKVGDILCLQEYLFMFGRYTGRCIRVSVTYILDDSEYLKDGYVILGITLKGCE